MYAAEQKTRPAFDQSERLRGAVVGAGETIAQQPQLEAVADRLRFVVEEMNASVGLLEKRLNGVLNPEFKNDTEGSTSAPRPVRCPLGDTIDSLSDDLHNTTQRLRGLIERLAT